MSFNTEEISLCKKIAEKHRKEVTKGDWWHHNKRWNHPAKIELVHGKGSATIFNDINNHKHLHGRGFPLMQISDCLEFLRGKGFWLRIDARPIEEGSTVEVRVFSKLNFQQHWTDYPSYQGETPLEACLKAVLAILEQKS